jgi:RND superfamily putative drug exporter
MAAFNVTGRLAEASARRPWIVVGLWIALFLVGGFLASRVGDALTTEMALTNDPESARADRLLEERLRGPEQARELVIVASEGSTVNDPEFEAFVGGLLGEIRGLGDAVEGATSFYETGDDLLVSAARDKTLLPVMIAGDEEEASDNVGPLVEVVEGANGREGFEVLTAGNGSIQRTFNELSEEDLQRAEIIGIPIALLILVLVFGALVAAGIPLVLALMAIVVSVGTMTVIGQAFELNFMVVNIITMIGLAVGIDYSLFIVHRYREERRGGASKEDAIATAGSTASRAVLFSGGTVIVGLLGLYMVPTNVYRSLATGAVAVALFAVLAALTLLPAMLTLLGDRVDALRLPLLRRGSADDGGGFWARITSVVMARSLVSVVVVVGLLVAAAVPLFSIEQGLAGVSTLPDGVDSRRAFETLDAEFSAGLISPAEIVVDAEDVEAPEIQQGISELLAALAADEGFGGVTVEANGAGDLTLVSALIAGDPEADPARQAIKRLRNQHIPAAFDGVEAEVLVTGITATEQDLFETIETYTPYVFAFVLGLSFLLLLVVFRSIVVPVKALIMNLLSVGAAYGLLVLVFQHGVGNEIFGFRQVDAIEAWLPLFLFAFLFGLSMDYHVFLLSRIRERFDKTGDNAASVAFGVRTTAGIITGAAAIMVVVFSAFAMGDLVPLQQLGFGLAVAVILDATIIRSVLVPASMHLLGDLNWYLPKWLEWLPDIRVEGGAAEGQPAASALTGGD